MNNFEAVMTLNIKKGEGSEVEDGEDEEHSDEIKIDNIIDSFKVKIQIKN
ncbi:MAG: hypothetical protein PHV23_01155 [Candidatus Gracilibacteria bacterium]|nr:hypothetical protein [Candidatus Gracilibacteria bacterium]